MQDREWGALAVHAIDCTAPIQDVQERSEWPATILPEATRHVITIQGARLGLLSHDSVRWR
jgi:hypothetical protein